MLPLLLMMMFLGIITDPVGVCQSTLKLKGTMFGYFHDFRLPYKVFWQEELLEGVLYKCVCVWFIYLRSA